jgi:hypothetical protein
MHLIDAHETYLARIIRRPPPSSEFKPQNFAVKFKRSIHIADLHTNMSK